MNIVLVIRLGIYDIYDSIVRVWRGENMKPSLGLELSKVGGEWASRFLW